MIVRYRQVPTPTTIRSARRVTTNSQKPRDNLQSYFRSDSGSIPNVRTPPNPQKSSAREIGEYWLLASINIAA
ncbi:hypothetical protein RE6C_01261 [Rhodopirellula europaea 6C]|uniref:Uncharacterized protein n=1 Tax=Rhodopirellula europaea 6C TaxID=1263867 RepID=M2AZD2_9BACT|nr:hypothetical protein RE6C_01261 [Rhodopirellula europaea 6C]